ncbi:MAG: hypothetical protein OHK0029_06540 [Armatimonadaceae bacterium]
MDRRTFSAGLLSALAFPPVASASQGPAIAQPLLFDFTTEAGRAGWLPTHDITALRPGNSGMEIVVSGFDPYSIGPAVTVPTGQPLWLKMRLRAAETGSWQVFFFAERAGPTEADSVRFPVLGGKWQEIQVPLPPLPMGTRYRFRIDPPGGKGSVAAVAWLHIIPRILLRLPENRERPTVLTAIPFPLPLVELGNSQRFEASALPGFLRFTQGNETWLLGHTNPIIGYQTAEDAAPHWVQVASQLEVRQSQHREPKRENRKGGETTAAPYHLLQGKSRFRDPDGAEWRLQQEYVVSGVTPGNLSGGIGRLDWVADGNLSFSVSEERRVVLFPWLLLLPGLGGGVFARGHEQAVFPGLEYLSKTDTSSSQADIETLEAKRLLPPMDKVTVPLLVMQAQGRWLAVAWEPSPNVAAIFDLPDRTFDSDASVMGLVYPGTGGMQDRAPGELLPYAGKRVRANETVSAKVQVFAGRGDSVVGAIEAYVERVGLPPLPERPNLSVYSRNFAAGWLDSSVREEQRDGTIHYRHAYPGDFSPHAAADAALCQDWLAVQLARSAPNLAARLRENAKKTLRGIAPADRNAAAVGHVRVPAPALVYGGMAENLARRGREARAVLNRFQPDGSIHYKPAPNRPDYGRTHSEPHASGLTGQVIESVLEAAIQTGDSEIAREAVAVLRKINRLYRNEVPRGAQTWEVPLHTPDILASAHLCRANVFAYELTGDRVFLDTARYWAWTGVPFVYLYNPSREPIGVYATIAVFGATNWIAPNWMGLPVQWCGLVYADALLDLAEYDSRGPWKQLAQGICVSGAQQTFPAGSARERQGLLPDSFHIPTQSRNDVCINPATTQIPLARAFDRPLYSRHVLQIGGPFLHAPGRIRDLVISGGSYRFTVEGWATERYTVAITGLRDAPQQVRCSDKSASFDYHATQGWLFLENLVGTVRIEWEKQ